MAASGEIKVDIVGRVRDRKLESLTRDLLLALERMHGSRGLSLNVCNARDALYGYLHEIDPPRLDPNDAAADGPS